MTNNVGSPPDGGWASLVPELAVTDLTASLAFWRDLLGFDIAYRRPAEKFVYLQCWGAQVMLCERNGRYETGPMHRPFGQGAMFQIYLDSIDPVLATLDAAGWPLYEPPAEAWYGVGDEETGLRKFFVQDPDGYLLMIGERLGRRPSS